MRHLIALVVAYRMGEADFGVAGCSGLVNVTSAGKFNAGKIAAI